MDKSSNTLQDGKNDTITMKIITNTSSSLKINKFLVISSIITIGIIVIL